MGFIKFHCGVIKIEYKNITLHTYLEKSYAKYKNQSAKISTMFTSTVSQERFFPNHDVSSL